MESKIVEYLSGLEDGTELIISHATEISEEGPYSLTFLNNPKTRHNILVNRIKTEVIDDELEG